MRQNPIPIAEHSGLCQNARNLKGHLLPKDLETNLSHADEEENQNIENDNQIPVSDIVCWLMALFYMSTLFILLIFIETQN